MLDIGKSSFTWSSLELWGLSTKTIQTNHWQTSIWTTTRLKIWHKLNTHSIRHASTIIWKALRCDTTQTTTLKVRVWVPRHTTPLTHTNFFFVFARWGVVWLVRASTYPPPLIMLASCFNTTSGVFSLLTTVDFTCFSHTWNVLAFGEDGYLEASATERKTQIFVTPNRWQRRLVWQSSSVGWQMRVSICVLFNKLYGQFHW